MSEAAAHVHEHPAHLQHHFDSPQQQFEAGKLGMWMFLATEVLLFGGLFCAYAIWRGNHPELFKYGSQFLDTTLGAVNTAVLIASSLTMATAVTMAQRNRQGLQVLMLALTLLGALAFLGIKYEEYTAKFEHGLFPGLALYEAALDRDAHGGGHASAGATATAAAASETPLGPSGELPPHEPSVIQPAAQGPQGLAPEQLDGDGGAARAEHATADEHPHPVHDPVSPANAHVFFGLYFMMTGLHGLHVLAGAAMLVWLLVGAARGRYNAGYFTPVDLGGLYWHIVDLIWIFLFPLFYLI